MDCSEASQARSLARNYAHGALSIAMGSDPFANWHSRPGRVNLLLTDVGSGTPDHHSASHAADHHPLSPVVTIPRT